MNELVFIDNQEVYTDHLTMAEMFGKEPRNVNADIIKTIDKLKNPTFIEQAKENGIDLDVLRFQQINYTDVRNRTQQKYLLNFDAFMLVAMAYTTRNAMLVKIKFINEFRSMQKQLTDLLVTRAKGKAKRLEVTNAVRDCIPESPNKKFKYKHFTDLGYKLMLDKNAKELRSERGLDKKANVRDSLTIEELEGIENIENEISVLIGLGMEYKTIKEMLINKYKKDNRKTIAQ
ncbi:Rha family transcriptional regulator [Priestia flexa]|uniref:Rha family transcriptional regulator n=1 Tax=Priestia flexa TaxID=86664 RepID=UPI003CFD3910